MYANKILFAFLFVALSSNVFAQTEQTPFELPEFIIEGKRKPTTIKVTNVSKIPPSITKPLTKEQLDSLLQKEEHRNSTRSIPAFILPERPTTPYDGFLRGELGSYITPQIEGGYAFAFDHFTCFAIGNYEQSEGHLPNAQFSKLDGSIRTQYIAPEKFYIFGGSLTETQLQFQNRSYSFFGSPLSQNRSVRTFGADVSIEGAFEGFRYEGNASAVSLDMTTANFSAGNTLLNGKLDISQRWENAMVGLGTTIDIQNLQQTSSSFLEATGFISFISDKLTLNGRGGFQVASPSLNSTRAGILLDANLDYSINKFFSFHVNGRSGLVQNNFRTLLQLNPYLLDTSAIDFTYDKLRLNASIDIHPIKAVQIQLGTSFASTNRTIVFERNINSEFSPSYLDATVLSPYGEVFIELFKKVHLTVQSSYVISSLADTNGSIPYLPQFKASTSLHFYPMDGLRFGTTGTYVGERITQKGSTSSIPSYIDIQFDASYTLFKGVQAVAKIQNLLNQDIFIWEMYRERGIFASGGIQWQF